MEKIDPMIIKYIKEGTSETPAFDKILDSYILTGKSGTDYDALIAYRINNIPYPYDDATKEVIAEYLETGNIKNGELKKALDLFMDPGKSNSTTMDDLFYRCFDTFAQEQWIYDSNFKTLMNTYLASQGANSGDVRLNKMLKRLQVTKKSSGSAYLDKLVSAYYDEVYKSGDKEQVQNAVNNAVKDSSSGGGTPTDTRVSFTVSLGYNDELKRAELERKGLSDDSMIAKQEVNG